MTNHHRLLATTVLTSLALLAPAAPVLAADLTIDNGVPVTITTPGNNFQYVNVGIHNPNQSLTISDGGQVTSEYLDIGHNAGSDNNSVTVTGAGSLLDSPGGISVGLFGSGNALIVRDGGSLRTSDTSFLGLNRAHGNHVDVIGEESSWSLDGELDIAGSDAPLGETAMPRMAGGLPDISLGNYVLVANGATVTQTTGATFIGFPEDSTGPVSRYSSLMVDGAGSSFSTSGAIEVGGTGALLAGEGAVVKAGSLRLAQGAVLGTFVSDTTASRIDIAGGAQLNGTLHATIDGELAHNRYTVLNAAATSGDFADFTYDGFTDFLSVRYELTGSGVDLVFNSDFNGLDGLNQNQRNVANALDGYFNRGGELNGAFGDLFGLSRQGLLRALSEMSGEVGATGGAQAAEQANDYFLNLMTRHRTRGPAGTGVAAARMGDVNVLPTADAPPESGGWSMWGAVFGGAANLPGDSGKGSHDTDTNAMGVATGWDYALSEESTVGVAVAAGGTTWDLDSAMGSGDSTFLQLGANASHHMGASYFSFAGAYAWHAMSTERRVTVPASEKLEADFNANSLAGRIEAGHRLGDSAKLGFTPYAALQAQAVYLPEYDEDGALGAGSFALTYDSNTATAVRGELGLALDASNGPARFNARAAWAHDWNSDGNVDAAFQSLPGTSFTVNGAETPKDIALVSVGAELDIGSNGVLSGAFDGEFGEDYQDYSGSLKLGFNW